MILQICVCDSSAGITFFSDKTEVTKRCLNVNYRHDLKVNILYEFSYNDNKMIILMNIL